MSSSVSAIFEILTLATPTCKPWFRKKRALVIVTEHRKHDQKSHSNRSSIHVHRAALHIFSPKICGCIFFLISNCQRTWKPWFGENALLSNRVLDGNAEISRSAQSSSHITSSSTSVAAFINQSLSSSLQQAISSSTSQETFKKPLISSCRATPGGTRTARTHNLCEYDIYLTCTLLYAGSHDRSHNEVVPA